MNCLWHSLPMGIYLPKSMSKFARHGARRISPRLGKSAVRRIADCHFGRPNLHHPSGAMSNSATRPQRQKSAIASPKPTTRRSTLPRPHTSRKSDNVASESKANNGTPRTMVSRRAAPSIPHIIPRQCLNLAPPRHRNRRGRFRPRSLPSQGDRTKWSQTGKRPVGAVTGMSRGAHTGIDGPLTTGRIFGIRRKRMARPPGIDALIPNPKTSWSMNLLSLRPRKSPRRPQSPPRPPKNLPHPRSTSHMKISPPMLVASLLRERKLAPIE